MEAPEEMGREMILKSGIAIGAVVMRVCEVNNNNSSQEVLRVYVLYILTVLIFITAL